jgi:hypothetical protein
MYNGTARIIGFVGYHSIVAMGISDSFDLSRDFTSYSGYKFLVPLGKQTIFGE